MRSYSDRTSHGVLTGKSCSGQGLEGQGGERATVSNESSGGQIGNSFHEELLVGTTGRRGRVGVNRVNKMEAIGFTIIQMLLLGPGTLLW